MVFKLFASDLSPFVLRWTVASKNFRASEFEVLGFSATYALALEPETRRLQRASHQFNNANLWQALRIFNRLEGCSIFPSHFDYA